MPESLSHYIDGAWHPARGAERIALVDPATEEEFGAVAEATEAEIDAAVAAARRAFDGFAATDPKERIALLRRIIEVYEARKGELARTIRQEIGAPVTLAEGAQAQSGSLFLAGMADTAEGFAFEEQAGPTRIVKEAIGVVAMITPWNWPINQIVNKVGPAIAAGCTMVLKPSENAPLTAMVFAGMMHEAGVPAGVFNLVNGRGPSAGARLSAHPGVDMVSFTGSTRAGVEISRAAAATIKRVTLELGGKSANILLEDADLSVTVPRTVEHCFNNSGQTCNAPTRLLVPRARAGKAAELAAAAAEAMRVGAPGDPTTRLGPVANAQQFEKVQRLIEQGIAEGARLVAGGPGRPEGLNRGYYVRPTVFADVDPGMAIAQEEIFGPVLTIIPYDGEDEAVRIANDSIYGLAGYVQSADLARAESVARRIRAGTVAINHPPVDRQAPMGGYRMSGNGRERGEWGLMEYLEVKAIMGLGRA